MYNKFMSTIGAYNVFSFAAQNLMRVKDIILHDSLIEDVYSGGSRGGSGGSLETPPSLAPILNLL